uniref:Uncharacterized protein n=1 Tax=Arundo donax TaxID=35708 RepID=A0A0A9HF48_ARUDO
MWSKWSGTFIPGNFKKPSPLLHLSTFFLRHPCENLPPTQPPSSFGSKPSRHLHVGAVPVLLQ